jgi:short-subunit dehydrogenase
MPRKPAESVVVITGASSGIGRATALQLARKGASLVLTARREEALRALAEQCERLGARALAVPADVTDREAVEGVARTAIERFGRIDMWVNNAAVTMFGRIEEVPYESYRRVIETNLFGYIHGARAVIPYFREQGSGVLVNVASVVGKVGEPYLSAYTASKFAIVGLSESLRMELRDAENVHVCLVLPASIDTPLFQQGANYMGRAAKPVDPVYRPERVAGAIARALTHPRREIYVGTVARPMVLLRSAAPYALGDAVIAATIEKKHFQDRTAEPSAGNLFQPMPQYATVDGGWSTPSYARRSGKGPLAGALLVGIGLALFALQPSKRRALPLRS